MSLMGAASAQIEMDGVRCGQLTCALEQYCSPETNKCAPCAVVCNKTHHNYDSGLCKNECQVYLLDMRYQLRSGPHPDHNARLHDTQPAPLADERLAQTALVVSCVALAAILVLLIVVCRGRLSWRSIKQKFQPAKNRVKQNPDLTHHNPHAELARPKHELKLEIRNPEPPARGQPLNARDLDTRTSHTDRSQGATTPKTVSTAVSKAISNRHPAEDTTLDFSYDNMAMNVTPPEPAPPHRF